MKEIVAAMNSSLAALLMVYLLRRSREPCDEPCDCCTDASSDESEDEDSEDAIETREQNRNVQKPAQSSTQNQHSAHAGPSTSGLAKTAPKPEVRRKTQSVQVTPDIEDKYDVLGKYVAEKVRQLGKEQRMYVERIIHETIFEGQMGKLNINSQLVVNTETFVTGPSDYAKKMQEETNSARDDVSEIKIEIDVEEPEDALSELRDEIEEESCSSDDAALYLYAESKRRRLEDPKKTTSSFGKKPQPRLAEPNKTPLTQSAEPDKTQQTNLQDVPDIKVEIVETEEHHNLGESETDCITTNVPTTNMEESNPRKRKISDESQVAESQSQEQIDKVKLEIDIEENWVPQEVKK